MTCLAGLAVSDYLRLVNVLVYLEWSCSHDFIFATDSWLNRLH